VAIFVDGCFWHGCEAHQAPIKHNREWWQAKIARNVSRDKETNEALTDAGWTVIRVWEHEAIAQATAEIMGLLGRLKEGALPTSRGHHIRLHPPR
jgi:DNA mismatch endonuclease (patch repair protein)